MSTSDYVEDLRHWEGMALWMYLDTKGLVTTGIGNYLPTAEMARTLPWMVGNRPATAHEITADWLAVLALPKGKPAAYYSPSCSCRLAPEAAEALCATRLKNEFLPGCRRVVPGFDELPLAARRALVDMIYSLGERGLASFGNMLHCIGKLDWEGAAVDSHRRGARESRNEWVAGLFRSCERPGVT